MATTPTPSHPQIVYLPYVSAVDPESSQLNQWLQETEIRLLDRVRPCRTAPPAPRRTRSARPI